MPHHPTDLAWWRANIEIDNPQGKPDRIRVTFPEHVDLRYFNDGPGTDTYIVVVPRPDTEPPPGHTSA